MHGQAFICRPSCASDIAFASDAPLTAGTGGVFFKARFGTLTFVDAGDLPKLSGDGNYLVYWVESATTVYEIRLYDRVNNTITPIINAELGGPPTQYSINQDGRYVAFTWNYSLSDIDTNGIPDIYLYDRTDRSTKLISTDSQGNLLAPGVDTIGAADPQISADGHFVIFSYGLLVYIKDLTTNNIATLQQQGSTPFISRDGHYIGFTSLTDHHVYVTPNPLITP